MRGPAGLGRAGDLVEHQDPVSSAHREQGTQSNARIPFPQHTGNRAPREALSSWVRERARGMGRGQMSSLCSLLLPDPLQPSLLSPPLDVGWLPLYITEQEDMDFLQAFVRSPYQVTVASSKAAVPVQCAGRAELLFPQGTAPQGSGPAG